MQKIVWPLLLVALGLTGWCQLDQTCQNSFLVTDVVPIPKLGQPVDSLWGVSVFYNGQVSHVLGRNLAPDGYNLGLKYQCVEFVKRFYYEFYNHKMPDSYGHAKSFFNPSVKDGGINAARDLKQFSNPSQSKPQKGDLLVFDETLFNSYGHVAIVSEVKNDSIQLIQQNPGPGASSRVWLTSKTTNGKCELKSSTLLGWLRMP